jgi:hypothetical protein
MAVAMHFLILRFQPIGRTRMRYSAALAVGSDRSRTSDECRTYAALVDVEKRAFWDIPRDVWSGLGRPGQAAALAGRSRRFERVWLDQAAVLDVVSPGHLADEVRGDQGAIDRMPQQNGGTLG